MHMLELDQQVFLSII